MKTNNYLTIKKEGSTTLSIKKSEFICTIARTQNEEEAQEFITAIKKKHAKAKHNCFAYTLGLHDEIQRESDNGEPSGTAGMPILEVLKNNKLHNVTAVVTRYFGGIKLGTGGLIRAYSNATSNTINNIGITKCIMQQELTLSLPYNLQGKLLNFITKQEIDVLTTSYTADVSITLIVDISRIDNVMSQITDLLNARVDFVIGPAYYRNFDYIK